MHSIIISIFIIGRMRILRQFNESDLEYQNQKKYLSSFGLQRNPIIGDGNCLFRSISSHYMATKITISSLKIQQQKHALRGNVDFFKNYFLEESIKPEEQINILAQPNRYAGQESILVLSVALNIDILVTFGGDQQSPSITTLHNSFSQGQSHQSIQYCMAQGWWWSL